MPEAKAYGSASSPCTSHKKSTPTCPREPLGPIELLPNQLCDGFLDNLPNMSQNCFLYARTLCFLHRYAANAVAKTLFLRTPPPISLSLARAARETQGIFQHVQNRAPAVRLSICTCPPAHVPLPPAQTGRRIPGGLRRTHARETCNQHRQVWEPTPKKIQKADTEREALPIVKRGLICRMTRAQGWWRPGRDVVTMERTHQAETRPGFHT